VLCPDHVKRQADDGTKAGVPHTVIDPANPTATISQDQNLPQDAADDYHFKLASLAPVDLVDLDQKDMGRLDHPASFLSREATGRYSCAEIAAAAGPRPPEGPRYTPDEALELALRVEHSGRPNHTKLRIPVRSHLNIPALAFALADCPDAWPLRGATFGWPLGRDPAVHLSGITWPNHNSAVKHMDQVQKYVETEVRLGALFPLGPAPARLAPYSISTIPLLTVPKPPHPTKVRVCGDMSHPAGASVNNAIPEGVYGGEEYRVRLPSIWDFAAMLREVGLRDVRVGKADLSRGYRQLPVCPGDWTAQLFFVPGAGYVMDTRAIFGGRPCGLFMQRTNQALSWAAVGTMVTTDPDLTAKSHEPLHAAYRGITNYIDDALFTAHQACADSAWQNLLTVYDAANIQLSSTPGHVSPPGRQVRALGFDVDCDTGILSIPADKLQEMVSFAGALLNAGHATRHQIKQLLGRICRCIMVITEGRAFIGRLLSLLRGPPQPPLDLVPLPNGALEDLRWWVRHGPHLNGRALIEPPAPTLTSAFLVDGRGRQADGGPPSLGGLYYAGKEFFAMTAPARFHTAPVHVIEAIALLAAARAWVHTMPAFSLVAIGSDNQPVVNAFQYGRATDPALAAMARLLWGIFATSTCTFKLRYVPSKQNSADGVSRLSQTDIQTLSDLGWRRVSLPASFFDLDETDVFRYQAEARTSWRRPRP
jgi:hypothetical protein